MRKKLPFLLSIPHGGWKIPKEVSQFVALSSDDIYHDGDGDTIAIYSMSDLVLEQVHSKTARAFIDLNRKYDDLPPKNKDGVIKSHTCHNVRVYKDGYTPDKATREILLQHYYFPYHDKLQSIINEKDILFCFDCHSMAATAPKISPDYRKKRPLVCLGNVNNTTCDEKSIILLAKIFQEVFMIQKEDISINHPFMGGYITRQYGNKPLPWIQIELNRSLYISQQKRGFSVHFQQLMSLNQKMRKILAFFHKNM